MITGLECRDVGMIAASGAITLYELSPQQATLEEAFMEMTRGSLEFQGKAHPAESSVS